MFRFYSYTIIRERINLCLLKLNFIKQCVKMHRCVVNTVVVWLHTLGAYCCMYVCMCVCTRSVRKVSSHFEYLENRSRGLDVTWQPVRGDLTVHL